MADANPFREPRARRCTRMDEVRLDAIVLLFAAAITLVSAGLFGLAPAASVFRTRSHMPSNTRGGGGSRTSSFLRWVVGTEVAVALVLVFGSSIFLETFIALTSVDPDTTRASV